MPKSKDPKLARAGVSAYNKPKRTPNHPTKKFVVVAKCRKVGAKNWGNKSGRKKK